MSFSIRFQRDIKKNWIKLGQLSDSGGRVLGWEAWASYPQEEKEGRGKAVRATEERAWKRDFFLYSILMFYFLLLLFSLVKIAFPRVQFA